MNYKLNQIRPKSNVNLTLQHKFLRVWLVMMLGGILGFLAKYTDGSLVGQIGTYLGFWILLSTILAAWSRSPESAAFNVFVFFASMLIVYYTYSMILFGFFPMSYFIAWSVIALLSPIGGYFIWYARGNGWIAALFAAIPIGLLLAEGYSFFYTHSLPRGFDIFSAILLFMILPKGGLQRLRILPLVAVLFFFIERSGLAHLLSG